MKSKKNSMFLRNLKQTYQSFLLGGGILLILLIVWEVLSILGLIDPVFSSSPTRIIIAGKQLIADGSLLKNILASGKIFILGYILAMVVGIPVGILMGWFKLFNKAFGPLFTALYTTPRIALMPLFIIWFGLGIGSKLALVFLSAVFPLIINMQAGMLSIDNELTIVAKSYNASQSQIFRTIALPMSIPFLITGLRLAVRAALMGVVSSEVFGGSQGIGYLIQYAGSVFQTDKVFVCVCIIAIFGIIADRSLLAVNTKFDTWRGNDL